MRNRSRAQVPFWQRMLARKAVRAVTMVAAPAIALAHSAGAPLSAIFAAQDAEQGGDAARAAASGGAVNDDPLALENLKFLRVSDEGKSQLGLEIAVTRFAPKDADAAEGKPAIVLVGVSHIGDERYYKKLFTLLNESDLVLYESVMPPGANGASGVTPEQKLASTRAVLAFVASMLDRYETNHQRYPATLDELSKHVAELEPRAVRWLERATIDAWGQPLRYEVTEDGGTFHLISLGADQRIGGESSNADIDAAADGEVVMMRQMLAPSEGDNLQGELAKALNLAFQLEAIDYSGATWQCSDMTMDQLERAFRDRDLDFTPFTDTLAGSSLPSKLVIFLLRMITAADALTGGAVSDTVKIVLIEMLGDETVFEVSFEQFGEGFEEVLIDERNQIVMDDLEMLVKADVHGDGDADVDGDGAVDGDDGDEVDSIAVFYGAGHMQDFAQRLDEQLGYKAVEQEWLRAIHVDLGKAGISEREVRQLRMTVRRALRQSIAQQKRRTRNNAD